jgi:hypothetical protein
VHEPVSVLRIGGFVEQTGPAGFLPIEVLVSRSDGDDIVRDCIQRSGGVCAERDTLNHRRSVAECVHLRPCQHHAYRALQRACCQHREHDLELRSQARAECATHERRHDPHVLWLQAEHAAHIALNVLHALRFVVDRELAAALDDRGRGIEFHRVVMLDRHVVFALVPHRGHNKRSIGIAARLGRGEQGLYRTRRSLYRSGCVALAIHISEMRRFVVLYADQRRRKARYLRRLGDDQRDRLAIELDLVIVKWPERRSIRSHLVLIGLIIVGHARTVLVREHGQHTVEAQGGTCIDARDATLRNRCADDAPVHETRDVDLGGILGGAGDLCDAIDAGYGGADVSCHFCSRDLLVGLRLRRALRRLGECAHDRAAR